jgi:hypothetical protein
MTIFINSRYEYSNVDYVSTKPNGTPNPIVFYSFSNLGLINYFQHVYVEGERLDQLAFKYYGNPEAWWMIPEYNPEISDFTNIVPGTVLRIVNA